MKLLDERAEALLLVVNRDDDRNVEGRGWGSVVEGAVEGGKWVGELYQDRAARPASSPRGSFRRP